MIRQSQGEKGRSLVQDVEVVEHALIMSRSLLSVLVLEPCSDPVAKDVLAR